MVVEHSKRDEGQNCEREGYWIRDIEEVMHCDSGNYEEDENGRLRCIQCRLIAT